VRRAADLRDERSFDHEGRDAGANFRFGDVLADLADGDSRIVAGTADLQYVTQLNPFAERHPDRFFEFGISEHNMLGSAAGLASCGFIPYVSTFASFAGIMGLENIKTDLAYPRMNVRVIATHAGISMGFFGTSHHATEDIAALRGVAGVTVVSPSDRWSAEAIIRQSVERPGPMYFRMGRGREPDVYDAVPGDYVIGGAKVVVPGDDLLIVATGTMVHPAVAAAAELAVSGISAQVVDAFSLKPFPSSAIAEMARGKRVVVTVEEHNVEGGLGTLVVEGLASAGVGVPVYKHGIYDEFVIIGPPTHLYEYYGLDATGITTVAARVVDATSGPDTRVLSTGSLPLWRSEDRLQVLDRRGVHVDG
jgi:transketolase